MRCYWPEPNPPCKPKVCLECETRIDGDETEGYWLERKNWQNPNTYHLFCLDCCAEKMTEWSNHPDVDGADAAKEVLYE
jgi:hypothetical protein